MSGNMLRAIWLLLIPQVLAVDMAVSIFGGVSTPIGKFPCLVSIKWMSKHICGGTILNNRYILTAAHCLISAIFLDQYTIEVGSNGTFGSGVILPLKEVFIHPAYSQDGHPNDICLAKTGQRIVFNTLTRPVVLSKQDVGVSSLMTVVGWGRYKSGTDELPFVSQMLNVTSISYDQCRLANYSWPITKCHLCTDNKVGSGFCSGDSGGMICSVYPNGVIVQRGVVSYTTADCATGYYDVYTRVFCFLDWIVNITQITLYSI